MKGRIVLKHEIKLKPTPMTREVMQDLENRGLIYLMGPGKHETPNVAPNTGKVTPLYLSKPECGGHKLIAVTKNVADIINFGTHADNEEFLLIGDYNTKPLYLLVAKMSKDEMCRKADREGLTAEDFVMLDCKFNDPECSFFTMLGITPHTEFTIPGGKRCPSFYVTEPTAMTSDYETFKDYSFSLNI